MYCQECGIKLAEGDKFCNNCGTKIKGNDIITNGKKENEKINSVKNNNKKLLIIGIIISVLVALSVLGVLYFKFINKSESIDTIQSVKSSGQNSGNDSSQINSEKTQDAAKEIHKEKEVFAKLLKSKKWLSENTDYAKSPDFIRFSVLDINQDGVCEMLLYHGDSGGLAGLTLSIVSYDVNEDTVSAQKINVSHGGYRGYVSNEKEIIVGGAHQGTAYMYGYILKGNKYVKSFNTFDTAGANIDESKATFKLNDIIVSKEKYSDFVNSINNNITSNEMYAINDENIKIVLGVDTNTISEDSIDRYSTLKFKTSDQAKEWLLKQDGDFIAKNNLNIKENNGMLEMIRRHFILESDDYYLFEASYKDELGVEPMRYLIGKHTGNVYLVGNQGGRYTYLIYNNQVIEKLKWDNKESSDWR